MAFAISERPKAAISKKITCPATIPAINDKHDWNPTDIDVAMVANTPGPGLAATAIRVIVRLKVASALIKS